MSEAGPVLVSGASGGVGAVLLPALRDAGWRVRALVHSRPVEGADEVARGDLADRDSLAAAARGASAVLHLAALTHARDPRAYRRVNVDGTANLLAAARREGVGRFVHGSSRSASADGGAYCLSKLEAERAVRRAGLPFAIVRLPELYGSGGREGTEQIRRLANRGAPIPLVGGAGSRVCPAHVEDAVAALVAALSAEAALGRTYTLAGECMSVREYAAACIAASRHDSRTIELPLRLIAALAPLGRLPGMPIYPDQPARLRASKPPASPEAATDLGYSPRPLAAGLREAARAESAPASSPKMPGDA